MRARLQVPSPTPQGRPVQVRLLIQHPMETGFRLDMQGTLITKNVIHSLQVTQGGRTVFRATLGSGVSANPYFQFWLVPERSGDLLVTWQDDAGVAGQVSSWLEVTPA